MLDEVDSIDIKRYTKLLYNIYDWSCYKGSGLMVIGIGNTVGWHQKLPQSMRSRACIDELVFGPYTFN